MGMFSDLDNLGKQQRETTPKRTTRTADSEAAPASSVGTGAVSSVKPDTSAIVTTKQPDILVPQSAPSRKKAAERPNVRTNDRIKIRHSFDIFKDQYVALCQLAYERQLGSIKKVPLGDLVQEALDVFLAAQHPLS